MSAPSSAPILRVEALRKSFGGVAAVAGATFTVLPGSMTALIGPNGAGKTTTFDLISGFARPDGGSITYAGRSIGKRSPETIARLGLVRTFQLTRVFRALTVRENLLVGSQGHPGERLLRGVARPLAAVKHERTARREADSMLERFGLGAHRAELAGNLSGGQRKLVELARVMMARPQLVLLDEPFAGVNPTLTQELLRHIREMRSAGITVLFVEHDLDLVMGHAEHVIVMANGSVLASGTPDIVRKDSRVLEAYIGVHAP
jgi:ABC-type branched-subunit amino acid transport system ATPase component